METINKPDSYSLSASTIHSPDRYNLYTLEDLNFSLKESLQFLKNELKRIEKKIIAVQLTRKYYDEKEGTEVYLDNYHIEDLNDDISRYTEKYEIIKISVLNLINKILEEDHEYLDDSDVESSPDEEEAAETEADTDDADDTDEETGDTDTVEQTNWVNGVWKYFTH